MPPCLPTSNLLTLTDESVAVTITLKHVTICPVEGKSHFIDARHVEPRTTPIAAPGKDPDVHKKTIRKDKDDPAVKTTVSGGLVRMAVGTTSPTLVLGAAVGPLVVGTILGPVVTGGTTGGGTSVGTVAAVVVLPAAGVTPHLSRKFKDKKVDPPSVHRHDPDFKHETNF